MARRRWFRPKPEFQASDLVLLRRHLLLFLAAFTFYDVWLFVLYPIRPDTLTLRGYAFLGLGTCLCLGTYLLRRYWTKPTSWFFVLGSLMLDALIYLEFGPALAMAHLSLLVVASALLLGLGPSLLTGAASVLIGLLLSRSETMPQWAYYWPVWILAICALNYFIGRALGMMDYWENEVGVRQRELVGQLRHRQGELNRTLKALDEACVSLERANDELIAMRQDADEARAMKEHFVANVSHEMRTPLNLIVGFAELMYVSPEAYDGSVWTPELENDLRQLYRASRHLQDLVNDVLDLSRIDASRLPLFRELDDIPAVITDAVDTVSPLFEQRGLSYEVRAPDELPQLFIDRTRIRQVMLNLLNNAARFTDSGGVEVWIEQVEDDVVVSVADTGMGIPEDELGHVFEEFRQVEAGLRGRGGAGLGLAISKKFVELHGGRMWVKSQLGRGSTFSFALPLPWNPQWSTVLRRTPDQRRADLSAAPVVVVDPDAAVADMLRRYLGDRTVLSAQDEREAESLVEREHPLAVIVNLPPDAPLDEWLGSLGETSERCGVPVIRCSVPSPSWLQQSNGFNAVLNKPVSRETLTRTLKAHCELPCTVLVVDDDPGFVSLMARILGTTEFATEVLSAYSGAQALRLAQEKVPDLVLLDLLMPEMDGFQVLRALREEPRLADTVVAAVTATSYAEEMLLRRGGHLSLSQSTGIPTNTQVDLIKAALEVVRPDYVGHRSIRSRA